MSDFADARPVRSVAPFLARAGWLAGRIRGGSRYNFQSRYRTTLSLGAEEDDDRCRLELANWGNLERFQNKKKFTSLDRSAASFVRSFVVDKAQSTTEPVVGGNHSEDPYGRAGARACIVE